MTKQDRKVAIIQLIEAKGWAVERLDLRQQTLRIAKGGKRAFVEIWRGMNLEMLDRTASLAIRQS